MSATFEKATNRGSTGTGKRKRKGNRRLVKHVFLDIEGFTQQERNADDQVMIIQMLNKIVVTALKRIHTDPNDETRVLMLPTGDGVCVCFLGDEGDYDEHIQFALRVLQDIKEQNDVQEKGQLRFEVRIGINTATDVVVKDIRKMSNIAGNGISDAQRVMNAGDGGNILMSTTVRDGLVDSNEYLRPTVQFLRSFIHDKHNKQHTVFQYTDINAKGLNNNPPRTRIVASGTNWLAYQAFLWLGHDLRWASDHLSIGISKERFLRCLRQIATHYAITGLRIPKLEKRVEDIRRSVAELPDPDWTEDIRSKLQKTIDQVLDEIGVFIQDKSAGETHEKEQATRHRNALTLEEWTIHSDAIMPSDILRERHGTLSIWANVTDEHNHLHSRNSYQYIISHAQNSGRDMKNSAYARYPNAWAIRRIAPTQENRRGSWSFICNAMEPGQLNIDSNKALAPGWHLFTVEWSSEKDFIRFHIDKDLIGETRFRNWPQGLSGKMSIGTWARDEPYFRFNSDVGPCLTVNRNLKKAEISHILKEYH